jgi:hypothetical protein
MLMADLNKAEMETPGCVPEADGRKSLGLVWKTKDIQLQTQSILTLSET